MFPLFPLLNKVIQNLRTTQEGEVFLLAPWWPLQPWFDPTFTMCVCGPSSYHSIPPGPTVTTGVCLGRQVVTSARMEALMQQYQAAGFSKEVSRHVEPPRRPSTNRLYDDRWLHFVHWAAGQGIDPLGPTAAQIAAFLYYLFDTHGLSRQAIKGYRSFLAAQAVLQRFRLRLSDMITSMELQRLE